MYFLSSDMEALSFFPPACGPGRTAPSGMPPANPAAGLWRKACSKVLPVAWAPSFLFFSFRLLPPSNYAPSRPPPPPPPLLSPLHGRRIPSASPPPRHCCVQLHLPHIRFAQRIRLSGHNVFSPTLRRYRRAGLVGGSGGPSEHTRIGAILLGASCLVVSSPSRLPADADSTVLPQLAGRGFPDAHHMAKVGMLLADSFSLTYSFLRVSAECSGGPGCSSMEGATQENGAFVLAPGASNPVVNPNGWTTVSDMLYIVRYFGSKGPRVCFSKAF